MSQSTPDEQQNSTSELKQTDLDQVSGGCDCFPKQELNLEREVHITNSNPFPTDFKTDACGNIID